MGSIVNHRAIILRLVAILVLVTSAFDYCAFDMWDPTAPMSSIRSETIRDIHLYPQSSAAMRAGALHERQGIRRREIKVLLTETTKIRTL
jgi:hypothetical protein